MIIVRLGTRIQIKAKEAEFRKKSKKAPALATVKQSAVLGKRKRRSKEEEILKGQAKRNVSAVLSCIIYVSMCNPKLMMMMISNCCRLKRIVHLKWN